jgi:heptosyltransferase-2
MGQAERVLIAGPAWVGDMVMAQSLFITLCRNAPGTAIDVLAPEWSMPLLARMPEVKEAVPLPVGHGELRIARRYHIAKRLRHKRYHQAIVMPRSLKSALIPFFAQIPRRTGYRGEMRYGLINDMRALDKAALPQVVQRYVALGLERRAPLPPRDIPHPRLAVDDKNRARLLVDLELAADGAVAVFVPGAEYGPAKRWPARYYAQLAGELAQAGYRIWLLGSHNDADVCAQVHRLCGGVTTDLSGKTRLQDVVDLVSLAHVVVTNDSGLMHIAAAVGCRVLALYGSSTPAYTPPLSEQARVFYLGLSCSPCFERECPLGHLDCLRKISVKEVYNACLRTGKGNRDDHG